MAIFDPSQQHRPNSPRIMGIVNVTPDSFSDGGLYHNARFAIEHGKRLVEEGADILDIGGESTRPGARPVSVQEELDRVIPVLEGLRDCGALLSVDTKNSQTMTAAVNAGAGMINDVTALMGDLDSLRVAANLDVPVCLMHMQGIPETMQNNPKYKDVMTEVYGFLQKRIEACETEGIDKSRLMVDPGIGFGKSLAHNISLIHNVSNLKELGVPVLVGLSRKQFIEAICNNFAQLSDPQQRGPGTLAANLWCLRKGVEIFRVHDVASTKQAFAVYDAIWSMA